METPHQEYHAKATNWRKLIQENQKTTRIIVGVFLLQYLLLGCIIDCIMECGPTCSIGLFIAALIAIIYTKSHSASMLLGDLTLEPITKNSHHPAHKQAKHILDELVIAANIRYTPKLYIMESNNMNALATGWTEENACIVLTRPLVDNLPRDQLQAVIAHELSHIRHQDIRLMLMLGVLSNIMVVALDYYYPIHKYKSPRKNKKSNQGNYGYIILLRYVIPILNTVMLLFISRTREYLADAGAVQLTRNNQGLAQALLAIHAYNQPPSTEEEHKPYEAYRQASYLFQKDDSWHELWATHPSIKKRLKALGLEKNS